MQIVSSNPTKYKLSHKDENDTKFDLCTISQNIICPKAEPYLCTRSNYLLKRLLGIHLFANATKAFPSSSVHWWLCMEKFPVVSIGIELVAFDDDGLDSLDSNLDRISDDETSVDEYLDQLELVSG